MRRPEKCGWLQGSASGVVFRVEQPFSTNPNTADEGPAGTRLTSGAPADGNIAFCLQKGIGISLETDRRHWIVLIGTAGYPPSSSNASIDQKRHQTTMAREYNSEVADER